MGKAKKLKEARRRSAPFSFMCLKERRIDVADTAAMLEVLNARGYRAECGECGQSYVVTWNGGHVVDRENFVAFAVRRCECGCMVTNFYGSGPIADEARSLAMLGAFTGGKKPIEADTAMCPQ